MSPAPGQEDADAPAKLRVPSTTVEPLHRARLFALLDGEEGRNPVVVVSGPAGSGKTTLLATWAAQRSDARVVWVTVDARDDDPAEFWPTLRRALGPEPAADFAAAVHAADTPVVLILDEADHLRDPGILAGLETLIRQPPDKLRLVLAARTPPRLHLSRLRLESRLVEIGPAELAFTRAETEALFDRLHVRLTPAELDQILRRTEGWPAGLRLAAMSLGERTTRAARLAAFPADDRAVVDYLTEEVLGPQPPHVHQFLRATSVCDRICADLATALAGQAESGEILDRLERANALVTRTDEPGGWYRYHPVLRDVLRAELDRRHPLVRRRLNHIAAEWFRDAGRPLVALRHAVAADDPGLVDDLLAAFGLREILSGRAAELHRLVSRLSPDTLARPLNALIAAAAALDVSEISDADRCLSIVDRSEQPLRPGRVRALHAAVVLQRAGTFDALSATAAGKTGDDDLDTLTLLNRGVAVLAQGDHAEAEDVLLRALQIAAHGKREHAVLLCRIQLAAVSGARGELSRMDERAADAISFAAERGWARTPHCAPAYTMRGALAYLRLDHDEAVRFISLAKEVQACSPAALVTHLIDAVISHGTSPSATTADQVRDHWRRLADAPIPRHVAAYLATTVHRIALTTGQLDWASDVLRRVAETLGGSGEHAVLQAITSAHRAKPGQAHRLLAPVLTGDIPVTAVTTPIDAWLLEASLLSRAGDPHRAHSAITKALTLAEPLWAAQPFRAAGVRDLLVKGTGRFGKLDRFVSAILAALPVDPDVPVDRLTSREHDLLLELPSMRTTEEIADSLFVSVNTVKTHLRGIYRKLGVNQRRDAVTVARERGLL
ncbi:LuxR C-terminal-related transcriptional regulator [Actinocrispum wychmicini]|uniref:LuxR family maltose regulon positive regulatory protein n=1 Tax=Actinocrispum wychmicini TaxID=1213861 RepID=A0A4R2IT16_9PSEU|nr:LuxR C-terminal-related transcriptional regulator [Actinocrispum wychmicini]TCO47379.1 LuxR family maltose regulon positive regulatory protein [Actinocrispum wychmicini]